MAFKIVITQTKTERKMVDGRWSVIKKKDGDEEYGYPPPREETVSNTVEIYSQSVEELDLPAVIVAVNGLAK